MNEEQEPAFDLADLPLGTYAACDVSDQPEWTEGDGAEGTNTFTPDEITTIRAMVVAASATESASNRIAIEKVWRLRLMDAGQHYLTPTNGGGWTIVGQNTAAGVYGTQAGSNMYPTNIIGPHNDIIVGSLIRDVPRVAVFPRKPDDGADIAAADAGNQYKFFLAKDNCFETRASEIARYFCTDAMACILMRPVADLQKFGVEDGGKPAVRMVMSIFGMLETKKPMLAKSQADMPYYQVEEEIAVSTARATYPWVAPDKIHGGDLGIAERQLARVARCSIKMALKGQYSTGDSMRSEVTNQITWFRPEYFMDDSCPSEMRGKFFERFPKGMRVDYCGDTFCMARNEGMDEVLTNLNCRTGNGQNRRGLTEAYATSNLRLNNWVELRDKSFRNGLARVFLDDKVFNVPALRASASRVGVYEPMNMMAAGISDPNMAIQVIPPAPVQGGMDEAINWFSGDLAELQTGAVPTLSGNTETDPETFGAAKLQNGQAMGRLTEPWKEICRGFCSAVAQAIRWAPRVLPTDKMMDGEIGGMRYTLSIGEMGGNIETEIEGDANFPQSWDQRLQQFGELWMSVQNGNPFASAILSDPNNLVAFSQFFPQDTVLPGLDSAKKQVAENGQLLKEAPIPNPQYQQIQQLIQVGTQEIQQSMMQGLPLDPNAASTLQQAQQALQQIPPLTSSVPVSSSDDDALEMKIALKRMNSPECQRMKNSSDPQKKAAYENLDLHYNEHVTAAAKKAAQNQTPVPPKTSISISADKLPPEAQSQALQKAGINVQPQPEEDGIVPHEIIQEKEGVDSQGVPVKTKVSLVGKGID